MTTLHDLRAAIRDVLVESGEWLADEVIVARRADIWNAVATAISASENGRCVVIDTPTGDPDGNRQNSRIAAMEITIAVNIVERPATDPDEDDGGSDARWQRMVAMLQGHTLGRSTDHDNGLRFAGFDPVPHPQHVIRQTIFKTRHLVSGKNTPPPDPPNP